MSDYLPRQAETREEAKASHSASKSAIASATMLLMLAFIVLHSCFKRTPCFSLAAFLFFVVPCRNPAPTCVEEIDYSLSPLEAFSSTKTLALKGVDSGSANPLAHSY